MNVAETLFARSERDPETGCLRWTGAHTPKGYGHIVIDGKAVGVHRVAHQSWIGPIPEGYEVDHVAERGCRYRDCIEPSHLEAVTQSENKRRQRKNGPLSHCHVGHELTEDNVYVRPGGIRACRTCKRRRQREYKARMRLTSKEPSRG